jgi:LysM repeat protein
VYAQNNKPKVHEVEVGESLYSIAKKYKVSVKEIFKINPSIADSTILPGQLIKIPILTPSSSPKIPQNSTVKSSTTPTKSPAATQSSQSVTPSKTVPAASTKSVFHEVEQDQTLYSIARKYSVSVEDLQKWNNIKDANIKPGTKLVISPNGPLKYVEGVKEVKTLNPSTTPVRTNITYNDVQDMYYQNYLDAKSTGRDDVIERGTAGKLQTENAMMGSNYFALHKTATIGSILKVKNLVNNKYCFVKVIGKLPETGENENILMRISGAAQKDLGINLEKCYVELIYYPL